MGLFRFFFYLSSHHHHLLYKVCLMLCCVVLCCVVLCCVCHIVHHLSSTANHTHTFLFNLLIYISLFYHLNIFNSNKKRNLHHFHHASLSFIFLKSQAVLLDKANIPSREYVPQMFLMCHLVKSAHVVGR